VSKNVFLAFRWAGDASINYLATVPAGTSIDFVVKRVSATPKSRREANLSLLLSQLFPTHDSPFVHTYACREDATYTYIVQERGFMDLECRLSPAIVTSMHAGERRFVSSQLVRAVTQLHSLGRFAPMESADTLHTTTILHRDIRPSNCLYVNRNGHTFIVLGDFGLSKTVAAAIPTVITSLEPCSLHPPDERDSPAKDVFLLGQTLFYVFTGKWPFVQAGAGNIIQSHASNVALGAVQLSHVDWGCCDVSTANLLLWMLERDPNRRPSIDVVAQHPCFWDAEALDNFLVRAHAACANDKAPSEITDVFLNTLHRLENAIDPFPPHDLCYGALLHDRVTISKVSMPSLPIADLRANVPLPLHKMGGQTTYSNMLSPRASHLCNFVRFLRNYTTHCRDVKAADSGAVVDQQCHLPVMFVEGGAEIPAGQLRIPTSSYVLRHPTLCWVVGELYRAHVERVIDYRKVYSVRFDGRTSEETRALSALFGLHTRHLSDQYRLYLSRSEKYDVDQEYLRSEIAGFVKCVHALGYHVFPHGMSPVTRTRSFMITACLLLTLTEVVQMDVLEHINTTEGLPAAIKIPAMDGTGTNVLITVLTRNEGARTLTCSGEHPEGAPVNTVSCSAVWVELPRHLQDHMGEFVLALHSKQLTTLLAEMHRKLNLLEIRNTV
jgi:serine/threonine protein kinase